MKTRFIRCGYHFSVAMLAEDSGGLAGVPAGPVAPLAAIFAQAAVFVVGTLVPGTKLTKDDPPNETTSLFAYATAADPAPRSRMPSLGHEIVVSEPEQRPPAW
ncbi:MAG: hypothetical protein ACKOOG_00535, partial [Actinomycetota bacterium]